MLETFESQEDALNAEFALEMLNLELYSEIISPEVDVNAIQRLIKLYKEGIETCSVIKDERAKGLIKRMKKFVEKPEVWEALDLNKTRGLNGMFNLHKYDLFDLSKYFQFDEVHSKDYFQSALEQALLKEEATDMVTNFKKISLTNNKIVKNNMTEQQCSLEQRILQRKLKKQQLSVQTEEEMKIIKKRVSLKRNSQLLKYPRIHRRSASIGTPIVRTRTRTKSANYKDEDWYEKSKESEESIPEPTFAGYMSGEEIENDTAEIRERCETIYLDVEEMIQDKIDEFYDFAFKHKYEGLQKLALNYKSKINHFKSNLNVEKRRELKEMEIKFDTKRKQGVVLLKQLITQYTKRELEEQEENELLEVIKKIKINYCKITD